LGERERLVLETVKHAQCDILVEVGAYLQSIWSQYVEAETDRPMVFLSIDPSASEGSVAWIDKETKTERRAGLDAVGIVDRSALENSHGFMLELPLYLEEFFGDGKEDEVLGAQWLSLLKKGSRCKTCLAWLGQDGHYFTNLPQTKLTQILRTGLEMVITENCVAHEPDAGPNKCVLQSQVNGECRASIPWIEAALSEGTWQLEQPETWSGHYDWTGAGRVGTSFVSEAARSTAVEAGPLWSKTCEFSKHKHPCVELNCEARLLKEVAPGPWNIHRKLMVLTSLSSSKKTLTSR
jgi:hypothetical protein